MSRENTGGLMAVEHFYGDFFWLSFGRSPALKDSESVRVCLRVLPRVHAHLLANMDSSTGACG